MGTRGFCKPAACKTCPADSLQCTDLVNLNFKSIL